MASLNKMQLIGNVGKDPESKYTGTGKLTVSFSVAVSNTWKDGSGEKKTDTEWINIEAWGKLAEIIQQYVKKGSSVYVEGRLKTDKYEAKDGEMKYFTKIVANSIQLLGGRNSSQKSEEVEASAELPPEDDVPF